MGPRTPGTRVRPSRAKKPVVVAGIGPDGEPLPVDSGTGAPPAALMDPAVAPPGTPLDPPKVDPATGLPLADTPDKQVPKKRPPRVRSATPSKRKPAAKLNMKNLNR